MKSKSQIYKGFQKLSLYDQAEYLKYLRLVIERTLDLSEKNRLIKFKSKLEKWQSKELKQKETVSALN